MVISVNKVTLAPSVGIMGGMFNPVHNGHIRAAIEFSQALDLTEVALMPCHQPAHKALPEQSSEQRAQMLALAIESDPLLRLDTREMQRPEGLPSYTVDSLAEMRAELGDDVAIYFAMGTDAFSGITAWHQWQRLFELANIVVLHRPGTDIDLSQTFLAQRHTPLSQRVDVAGCLYDVEVPALDISSTQIRRAVQAQKNIRGLVPETVENYINQYKLYQ